MTFPYTIKAVIEGAIAAGLVRVPRRYALVTGLGYAVTGSRQRLVTRLVRILYWCALCRMHKVFFQNPDGKGLSRELGLLPANIPSVVVNGSGVDVAQLSGRALSVGPRVFLLAACLLGDKGVREYVEPAWNMTAYNPGTVFRLVGWIDENPYSIRKQELNDWMSEGVVEYLGRLSDVRLAVAGCTVYVLLPYRKETHRAVLEFMAMGRLIFTTYAPGCRETVVDGDNGFLVPLKSIDVLVAAREKFIFSPDLVERMGKRSREIAESKYDANVVMLREMGIEGEAK
ncbi:MAG TPA: glycosyltransferase family 1 protein [Moraxellaceae bacterium]|nr:glycosyltransferase family 1 protein [Moraxellaceae bacterium]